MTSPKLATIEGDSTNTKEERQTILCPYSDIRITSNQNLKQPEHVKSKRE